MAEQTGEFEFHLANGQPVFTGMKTPDTLPVSFTPFPDDKLRPLDDICEIIDDTDAIDITQELGPDTIWSQGNKSSCNAYMVARMIATLIWLNTGRWIKLCPEFIYMLINGGRDQGSMLDDGMVAAYDHGCPEFGALPYQSYQKNKHFDKFVQAKGQAMQKRLGEAEQMPTDGGAEKCWWALISCISGRGTVGLAVHVGGRYMDSGKMAGVDRGPGNHAVPGDALVKLCDKPRSVADIGISVPGSWGKAFADGGRAVHTIKNIENTYQNHALYGARSVFTEPDQISATRIN